MHGSTEHCWGTIPIRVCLRSDHEGVNVGTTVSRRSFVKWGTAAVGASALVGFAGCAPSGATDVTQQEGQAATEVQGEWLNAPCYNNCSCGSSRCLNKVYVADGVPLKTRTDEVDEDSYAMPQRRACLRGRAKMSEILSPARIKYPMKRKNFSLDNPQGDLRGKDEWERMGWDEALDLVAEGIKKMYDQYGPTGVLCGAITGRP